MQARHCLHVCAWQQKLVGCVLYTRAHPTQECCHWQAASETPATGIDTPSCNPVPVHTKYNSALLTCETVCPVVLPRAKASVSASDNVHFLLPPATHRCQMRPLD